MPYIFLEVEKLNPLCVLKMTKFGFPSEFLITLKNSNYFHVTVNGGLGKQPEPDERFFFYLKFIWIFYIQIYIYIYHDYNITL